MNEESLIPALPQIDPNILGIVIGIVFLAMVVLLFFFIPRVSTLQDLRTKLSDAEHDRDYAREQWSIEQTRANKAEEALKKKIKEAEDRKKQADNKAKQISKSYDMFV